MAHQRPRRFRLPVGLLAVALVIAACSSQASPSALPTPEPSPTATPSATPEPTPTPSPTPVPTPSPTPLNTSLLNERLTVLVIGTDASDARRAQGLIGANTDSLMVVSVSADHAEIAMFSLPRDIVDVPLPDGRTWTGKINAMAHFLGYPAFKDAVATLLGLPIDHYLKIDMDDFIRLADFVDGVDVDVETRIFSPRLDLDLHPGPQHLTPSKALNFTRYRGDSDYARAGRQQQVVLALVQAYVDPATEWTIDGVLRLLEALETDFDLADIPTLVEIGRRSVDAHVTRIVLQPPRFSLFVGNEPGTTRGWVMIPNVAEMRAYVDSVID
jgi:LCP family protein required for cell wall assembly